LTAPVPETPETASVWRRALGGVAVDVGLLRRRRDFGLLVFGQAVSEAGSMATFVAIPFQAYELTGSSLAVGLLGVAEFVPVIALALVGGALADAFDRRRLVQIAEVGAAVVAGALLVNAVLPDPQLWVLYVCSAFMAAFTALRRPPLDALIPRLVGRDELKAAAALQFSLHNMASISGPALGGVLIAAAGLGVTYGLDVVSFALSLVVLTAMRTPPGGWAVIDAAPPSLRTIAEGVRYARSRQELVGTYLVDMNAMFFGMPMALFPAIAKRYGGAEVLGLLYAAPSAGSIAVTLTSGWATRVHRHGRAIVYGAAAWGAAIVVFGFADVLWLALACLAAAGAMDTISGIFRSTIWNETIPDHLRGRLAGVEMISWSSGPLLGDAEAGVLAALAGVRASVVSGGVACIAGTAVLALALPRFWSYDSRTQAAGDAAQLAKVTQTRA
jgi:MFS family permease